jgi:UDP-N-acetylmuramoyl-tripeptide--D-alanyl-D-alanine ligase
VITRGGAETECQRVCTDSRAVQPGDLFVALAGEKFDAHQFLAEAAARGAAAMLIESARKPAQLPACAVVEVPDTCVALGQLAAAHRAEFDLPVIAVAGSNGKTTTKELVAAVLRTQRNPVWSEASFNNDIGVPLTLLRLESVHRAAVLEVGTNHPGELMPLVKMVRPRYGIITSIGREHLEFFGDLAGVAQEEGVLGELLPPDGKLFLNGDSEWAEPLARRATAPVVRVGLGADNAWRATAIQMRVQCMTFRVEAPWAAYTGNYRVNLLGRHQVLNALYAIAVGAELGLPRDEIARGLEACQPPKMRMQFCEAGGVRVLNDAYNANADSMAAALEVLQELPCKGRRVAVLGDMAELGEQRDAAHLEVGRRAAETGVSQLVAVGRMAGLIARGAREAGLNRVLEIGEVEAAGAALKKFLKPGDVVLLKASRTTRLERVAEALCGPGMKN